MMKSPTSLIRFRNAVGVMLALSALFAVVISAVTITQDRAIAEHPGDTHVTVTFAMAEITVEEGTDVTVTVMLSADSTVDIPLTVTDGDATAADDYTLIGTPTAGFTTSDSDDVTVATTTDDSDPGPVEMFTIGLDLPDGYTAGSPSSVTITITDATDNGGPSGRVQIGLDDTEGRAANTPEIGEKLSAVTTGVSDPDHVDDPLTLEVDESKEAPDFMLQWQRDNVDIADETNSEYTLTTDDLGALITVDVTAFDKFRNGDNMPDDVLSTDSEGPVIYNKMTPYISRADTNTNMRIDVGDMLTADTSGLVDDQGAALSTILVMWQRDGSPITEDVDNNPATPPTPITGTTYDISPEDLGSMITATASYVDDQNATQNTEASNGIGPVVSPSAPMGQPTITGTGQVGQTLTADTTDIDDDDGIVNVVFMYQWLANDMDIDGATSKTYELTGDEIGKTISVKVSFMDDLGDPGSATSEATIMIAGSPGEISRIEPAIRGITVSAGDKVMLAVDVYGLQDAKDNGLGGTFEWTQKSGDNVEDLDGSGREINYTAPDSPGTYTIVASLSAIDCDSDDEDACSAEFKVQVRRPSAAPDDGIAPQNPPGEIPTILTDGDGNQYEVFTPEGGGTFTGEGYTLSAGAGAIPNGEYIGVRVSDEGSASNAGMTHQRYTLGGNMYSVSAVDANNAEITSYALNSAATVCVPLPDELRSNISNLALVAINADGSLTILSASVRLGTNGTQVCGNLSGLPASVAVGSSGAPAPLPTPVPPTATPEAPPTGGAAPTSNSALWALLLGFAVVASGTFLVIGRRRESTRK